MVKKKNENKEEKVERKMTVDDYCEDNNFSVVVNAGFKVWFQSKKENNLKRLSKNDWEEKMKTFSNKVIK